MTSSMNSIDILCLCLCFILPLAYCFRYLVGFLKSQSEINRIQKERMIKKEMEELAEKRKEQAAAAALVEKHVHDAATTIANAFRKKQAKKYVSKKRHQSILEKCAQEVMEVNRAATVIQARFRTYSVRNYFFRVVGERFRVNFKKRKKRREKKSEAEELKRFNLKKKRIRDRVLIDLHERRLNDRNKLIADIYDEYAIAVEVNSRVPFFSCSVRFILFSFIEHQCQHNVLVGSSSIDQRKAGCLKK